MTDLVGAIAYRTSPLGRSRKIAELIGKFEPHRQSKAVNCPKCGDGYSLLEGCDAVAGIADADLEFMAKALSSSHPCHPDLLVIRDPDGSLNKIVCSTINCRVEEEQKHSAPDVTLAI